MKKYLVGFLLDLSLTGHSYCYRLSSKFACMLEGLHPKHRIMDYHRFFVDNVTENDSVLDLGCGNGFLAYDVSKKAKKVYGIDIKQSNIDFAKSNFSNDNIEYVVGDVTKKDIDADFDVIMLSNVLEHIKHRKDFLVRVQDFAPRLLIRVPMIDREWPVLYKRERGLEWRLDKTHYTEFTAETFKALISSANLKMKSYTIQFGEIWAVIERG